MIIDRPTERLLILEGPDGGGKSRLATTLTKRFNAYMTHGGPFPRVAGGYLARFYAEMMLPALLGFKQVVMDRCWLSEPIYGLVFREGEDRIGRIGARMLERLALRAETSLVLCLPSLEHCLETFAQRPEAEYLKRTEQLVEVYHGYKDLTTDLPLRCYNYECDKADQLPLVASRPHLASVPSGGNLEAPFVLVGETFGAVKSEDPFYQVPFVSFNRSGCSWWLTEELEKARIHERELLWLNADFPTDALEHLIHEHPRQAIFTLGEKAKTVISSLRPSFAVYNAPHPQHHKRFKSSEPYALIHQLLAAKKGTGT